MGCCFDCFQVWSKETNLFFDNNAADTKSIWERSMFLLGLCLYRILVVEKLKNIQMILFCLHICCLVALRGRYPS